jgi:orotate phosphoribosyltransferase
MKDYQSSFIEFLIHSEALCFGEFTLKSGRISPYFFNSARFNSGKSIATLSRFYSQHIIESIGNGCISIFGPAYKGIPLAVATAMTLCSEFNYQVGYTFNRKEAKDHGDRGELVGLGLNKDDAIVIVEDVITAGTTLKEVVPQLRERYQVDIKGVIISLDRCERGGDKSCSAKDEAARDLGLNIYPLITTHEIISYLEAQEKTHPLQKYTPLIEKYLETYGAA